MRQIKLTILALNTKAVGSLVPMYLALPPLWRKFLASTLAVAFASAAWAQVPTPEQLEILRNLTPEQQQAVMEQLAGGSLQSGVTPPGGRDARSTQSQAVPVNEAERRRQGSLQARELPEDPVIKAEDTVLVDARLPMEADERQQRLTRPIDPTRLAGLERLVEQIRSRNPYQLDRNGQLHLPGLAPIALGGLTERQATERLSYEPGLLDLEMRLTRLPLERAGVEGLKPFGYDLFNNAPSTFAPITDVPVPADYVLGPGDELTVLLYGSQNRTLRLQLTRDGVINFPELGPIRLGGMTFNAARQAIESRVAQQMIGVQASVTMGETRSIRVLVTGEAQQPGYYTVSGLATMTTALYASGGIKTIGSLRDIQLKR